MTAPVQRPKQSSPTISFAYAQRALILLRKDLESQTLNVVEITEKANQHANDAAVHLFDEFFKWTDEDQVDERMKRGRREIRITVRQDFLKMLKGFIDLRLDNYMLQLNLVEKQKGTEYAAEIERVQKEARIIFQGLQTLELIESHTTDRVEYFSTYWLAQLKKTLETKREGWQKIKPAILAWSDGNVEIKEDGAQVGFSLSYSQSQKPNSRGRQGRRKQPREQRDYSASGSFRNYDWDSDDSSDDEGGDADVDRSLALSEFEERSKLDDKYGIYGGKYASVNFHFSPGMPAPYAGDVEDARQNLDWNSNDAVILPASDEQLSSQAQPQTHRHHRHRRRRRRPSVYVAPRFSYADSDDEDQNPLSAIPPTTPVSGGVSSEVDLDHEEPHYAPVEAKAQETKTSQGSELSSADQAQPGRSEEKKEAASTEPEYSRNSVSQLSRSHEPRYDPEEASAVRSSRTY